MAKLVHKDLRVMSWLAPFLVGRIPIASLANPPALVELFAETIVEELDFRMEAANMVNIAMMLRARPDRLRRAPPAPLDTGHPARAGDGAPARLQLRRASPGSRRYGIDTTEAVVRTAMISLMEGAMVKGVFHGDLHGGNLFVMADGRTALLDFGIVGRLSNDRRMAFLRMMLGAIANDIKGQLAAIRDLGALPADTDLDAVIRDLRLDQPPVDPTTLTGEELIAESPAGGQGPPRLRARMPKELMLYVKNMVFLDGAIARLAPDLDLLAEIAKHLDDVHRAPRRAPRQGAAASTRRA